MMAATVIEIEKLQELMSAQAAYLYTHLLESMT